MASDHDSRSDEELARLAREALPGDTRSFEALVLRHQGRVVANCRYLTRSPADAEDLAQDVLLKAFFGLGRFEGRSQFRTWLNRIKVNHCLNHLKKSAGQIFVDVDDPALDGAVQLQVASDAEAALLAADRRRQIAAVLDAMPDTLRIPLVMCDADGLSYEQIAESLDIGLSAVKMRIKRGREQFERLLETAGHDLKPAPHGASRR
jgi:RNA polymerase sigma-70 factor, ECF subfamily